MPSKEALPPFPPDAPIAGVPTVDCARLLAGDESQERAMFEAATGHGFFYLVNHKVDSLSMFDLADQVFDLPFEEKEKYDMRKTGTYFGYKKSGSLIVDQNGTPDLTEFYNISKNDVLGISAPTLAGHPGALLERKLEVQAFMRACHRLVTAILRALSSQLGLERNLLSSMHDIERPSGCQTRLTHAPPAASNIITMGEHTDFGSVTVLFNRVGGLQAMKPGTREWKFVVPKQDCAIVNLGDALVKLSGNRLYSALHRVVGPPGEQGKLDRQSVVYFCRPNSEVRLQSLYSEDEKDSNEKVMSADEWTMWRITSLAADKFKGPESYKASRGTAHTRLRA